MKKKFYSVKKGYSTGIFENWTECSEQIKGFPGAEYRSFSSRQDAEAYLSGTDLWTEKIYNESDGGFLVAFTSGSSDRANNKYSFASYLILRNREEELLCNFSNNENYIENITIIGEVLAVMNTFDYAISNDYKKIKIYHNHEGIEKWITGDWLPKSKASKLLVGIYNEKYSELLDVEFEKVQADSSIIFSKKARQGSKQALMDREKRLVSGNNWFRINNITNSEFETIIEILDEIDNKIAVTSNRDSQKTIYKITHGSMTVTASVFSGGQRFLLLQGKNNDLYKLITSTIVELTDKASVETLIQNAYRIKVDRDALNRRFEPVEQSLPPGYPSGIKRLVKQSIINLTQNFDSEDYSQYAFPALRALEGHIKYLIIEAGGTPGRQFNCFNKDSSTNLYFVNTPFADGSKNASIAKCYNYYKSRRDTLFHFGDIIGPTDNTHFLSSKSDADKIIQDCIELIRTEL